MSTPFTGQSPLRPRGQMNQPKRRWADWQPNLRAAGVLGMVRPEPPNALSGVGRWRFSLVRPRGFGVKGALENLRLWENQNRRPVLFIRGPGMERADTVVLIRADDFLEVFGGYTQHMASMGRLGGNE